MMVSTTHLPGLWHFQMLVDGFLESSTVCGVVLVRQSLYPIDRQHDHGYLNLETRVVGKRDVTYLKGSTHTLRLESGPDNVLEHSR
jgi:hypothetical protein